MKTKIGDSILVCMNGTGPNEPPWIWKPDPPLLVEGFTPNGKVIAAGGYLHGIRSWIVIHNLREANE